MDVKVTKKRFFNLVAYDWIKIVALSVAIVFVWILLFTTCATRATDGQQFYFVLYGDVSAKGSEDFEMLKKMKKDGDLSYDVLEYSVNSITKAGNYSAQYMLSLRNTTHEADVFLIYAGATNKIVGLPEEKTDESDKTAETAGGTTEGAEEKPTEKSSDIKGVLDGGSVQSIDKLLSGAKSYLEKFGANFDPTNPTVDDAKIERYFRSERITSARNYKKLYKTESQIKAGVKNEQARIRKLLEAYLRVSKVIKSVKRTEKNFLRYYIPANERKKENPAEMERVPYGIDLALLNADLAKLSADEVKALGKEKIEDRWVYADKNGDPQTAGITLCVSDYTSSQRDLQYEAVTLIDYFIRTFSRYAD